MNQTTTISEDQIIEETGLSRRAVREYREKIPGDITTGPSGRIFWTAEKYARLRDVLAAQEPLPAGSPDEAEKKETAPADQLETLTVSRRRCVNYRITIATRASGEEVKVKTGCLTAEKAALFWHPLQILARPPAQGDLWTWEGNPATPPPAPRRLPRQKGRW